MNVALEYCTMWGYYDKALGLRDTLVEALGNKIKDFKLIPSKGGCFELTVDGRPVYSKLKTGQFPNDEDMVDAVGKLATA